MNNVRRQFHQAGLPDPARRIDDSDALRFIFEALAERLALALSIFNEYFCEHRFNFT